MYAFDATEAGGASWVADQLRLFSEILLQKHKNKNENERRQEAQDLRVTSMSLWVCERK